MGVSLNRFSLKAWSPRVRKIMSEYCSLFIWALGGDVCSKLLCEYSDANSKRRPMGIIYQV